MPTISLLDLKLKIIKNHLTRISSNVVDAFFENVVLLLRGNGDNGGQNNTFLDSSANNFAITRNGNATQGTFSPYGDNWSNYFDGTGDLLTTPDNAAFDFGTGDFTIECWVYIAGNSALDNSNRREAGIFCPFAANGSLDNSYGFQITGDLNTTGTGLAFVSYQSGGEYLITGTAAISQNAWHHIAVARSGTTTRLFLDGSQITSGTLGNQTINTIFPINIGKLGYTGYIKEFNGYISNLRVLKGTALYTGSYTVPTAPLTAIANTSLLTCQSNRFIDKSTNNFTITPSGNVSVERFSPFAPTAAYTSNAIGGSGYFDGTDDWLSAASDAAFNLGTGNFTIECWAYFNAAQGDVNIVDATANNGIFLKTEATVVAIGRSGTANDTSFTYSFTRGQWYHIAFSRSGSTVYGFVNGVLLGSNTNTNNYVQAGLRVGADGGGGRDFNGYLSDLRLLKGTAQYTATFTPPTAPLTAITNTSLLLNFTNAAILDNAMISDLETAGNAQISTSVKKYGTGSLAFDGTGDWLNIRSSDTFVMGTGDFTVEFWIYIAARTGGGYVYATGTQANDIFISFDSNGNFLRLTNQSTVFAVTGTISLTTWTHIAVVRSGGSSKIYVDGTGGTAVACTINFTATGPSVGASNTGVAPINGYIDDLRITKGVARYTSNFTPPTEQFPDL